MRSVARIARQLLASNYALMAEYRAELFFWMLAGVLPFILMGLWMQAGAGGNLGQSPTQIAQYFLAVFIVRQLTIVWVIWEFEFQIVEGRLSSQLLKPLDPVWNFVAMHVGEQAARLPFWILVVAIFFGLYPAAFRTWNFQPASILLGIAALALTFTLRFTLQYCFAMLAFWIERASSLEQVSFLPYLFLSGLVAPLDYFPPAVREFAAWTPFPYLVYFPARLLTGQSVELGRGFATMLGWIVVLLVVNRWLWRRGLRQYSGMGA